jgi:MarR family transcriptional regulator, transcriptional regulator for hemolysin
MTGTSPALNRTVPDITGLFVHAAHVLNTRLAAALAEIGITGREQCVLWHALEDERTQAQLADIADLDKTTMVVTVDRLEQAGLAERRPSGTDRRARIIQVTEAGEKVATKGQRVVDRVHREVLAELPEEIRAAFTTALDQLVSGPLAEPVASEQQVRRGKRARA